MHGRKIQAGRIVMSYIIGIIGILTCIGAVIHATRQGKDEGLFDLDAYRQGEGK